MSGALQAWLGTFVLHGLTPGFSGLFYTTGGRRNYRGISDPRINELNAKQSSILDPAQRRLLAWEVEKLVIQQGAFVPFWWRQDVCLIGPNVRNQVCPATNHGSTLKFEIAWLDK